MRLGCCIFFIILCFTTQVFADDAVEASATGNIVFQKTNVLIMQSELLKITKFSEKNNFAPVKIAVDFHIRNKSMHAITRKIAFVLPPIYCQLGKNYSWLGFHNSSNQYAIKDFKTLVNGKLQSFKKRSEAFLNGKNITLLLKKLNIPLNPCDILFNGSIKPQYVNALHHYHLLTHNGDPAWAEHEYFEWKQTFQPNQTIDIYHTYTTTTGGSVLNPRTISELNAEFLNHKPVLKSIWNRDLHTLKKSHPQWVKNSGNAEHFCVAPQWVRYHLTTGAEWIGGIRHFTLIIKDNSGLPFAINQFYKKSDVAQINLNDHSATFTFQNFVPSKNIFVQFLVLPQSLQEKQFCKTALDA